MHCYFISFVLIVRNYIHLSYTVDGFNDILQVISCDLHTPEARNEWSAAAVIIGKTLWDASEMLWDASDMLWHAEVRCWFKTLWDASEMLIDVRCRWDADACDMHAAKIPRPGCTICMSLLFRSKHMYPPSNQISSALNAYRYRDVQIYRHT